MTPRPHRRAAPFVAMLAAAGPSIAGLAVPLMVSGPPTDRALPADRAVFPAE